MAFVFGSKRPRGVIKPQSEEQDKRDSRLSKITHAVANTKHRAAYKKVTLPKLSFQDRD